MNMSLSALFLSMGPFAKGIVFTLMAMSAYYLKGVAPPHVQLWTIFQGCFPFLSLVFVTMILVYVFPQLVYWLPGIFYGN